MKQFKIAKYKPVAVLQWYQIAYCMCNFSRPPIIEYSEHHNTFAVKSEFGYPRILDYVEMENKINKMLSEGKKIGWTVKKN